MTIIHLYVLSLELGKILYFRYYDVNLMMSLHVTFTRKSLSGAVPGTYCMAACRIGTEVSFIVMYIMVHSQVNFFLKWGFLIVSSCNIFLYSRLLTEEIIGIDYARFVPYLYDWGTLIKKILFGTKYMWKSLELYFHTKNTNVCRK